MLQILLGQNQTTVLYSNHCKVCKHYTTIKIEYVGNKIHRSCNNCGYIKKRPYNIRGVIA